MGDEINLESLSKLYKDLSAIVLKAHPRIKGAHCASIVYGVIKYIQENQQTAEE